MSNNSSEPSSKEPSGETPKKKGAPDHPPATPLEARTPGVKNSRVNKSKPQA